jgi:hypothetical protein
MDPLETREKIEAEQMAEGEESDFALTVTVHIVLLDPHLGAVAKNTLDHGRNFGGGTTLDL